MPDTIGFEMHVTEPAGSNPFFESKVENFIASLTSTTSSIAEWSIWNPGWGVSRSSQGKIWSRRGNFFDKLGGNNLDRIRKNYKAADYLKGGVVGQIKSIDSTNPKYIEKVVAQAYKKMIAAIKSDSNLLSAQRAELKIIVPTGTNNKVIQIIETAGKRFTGNQAGIKITAPKIIKGIPGKAGTVLRGLGIAGGILSTYQLHEDIEKGDIPSAIGSGTSSAAAMLEIGAGLVGSTALAVSAAVVGAFALGYAVGTLINNHLLSEDEHYIMGRVIAELTDHGWDNIKDYYLKNLLK